VITILFFVGVAMGLAGAAVVKSRGVLGVGLLVVGTIAALSVTWISGPVQGGGHTGDS
jgi:hypothetical protein